MTCPKTLVPFSVSDGADLHCEPPFGVPLAERADVLVFETEPLTQPIEVIGDVEVELFLSSTAPDTDLFAMLLDIYPASESWPNGYRTRIKPSVMFIPDVFQLAARPLCLAVTCRGSFSPRTNVDEYLSRSRGKITICSALW